MSALKTVNDKHFNNSSISSNIKNHKKKEGNVLFIHSTHFNSYLVME